MGLSPAQRHTTERIYSGKEETIVLTVTIYNPIPPTGAVKVELLRNGAAVPDGVLNKLNAVTSRTWFLTRVKTLDLVARDRTYSSGRTPSASCSSGRAERHMRSYSSLTRPQPAEGSRGDERACRQMNIQPL